MLEAEERLSAMLGAAGLAEERLDVWEGWKVFKAFLKEPVEADGEGSAIEATFEETSEGEALIYLTFFRQFTAIDGEESTPIRYVGIEFVFAQGELPLEEEIEIWSYDFPTHGEFVSQVEGASAFQLASAHRALESSIVGGEV
jgi:hypothetical protein